MQPPWRIELLGELRAVHGSRVVTRFRSQKTGLLLAYLAYHLQRPHRREQLCDWLWPDDDPSAARHNLRNVLHWLREAMELPDAPAGTLLLADRTTVQLNPTVVTTDVAEFTTALEAAARAGDSAGRAQFLAQAVDLYRGELLPGCYDGWILQEREWLAERFFQALGQRIAHLEHANELNLALEMAQRGVRLDPLREEAHAELMRLYAAAGQPTAALRQYAELERALKAELDTAPSPATRALAHQIERQSLVRRASLTSSSAVPASGASARVGAHARTSCLPGAEGENRLVTVLFADMSRSVETMRELYPEDAAALVNRLFGVMVDAVLKYEGQVDRFLGDGVLAVFGMLQAHEDDGERAIRAALDIRTAVRRLGLEVTAGINTGAVYVGAVGPQQHQERTVIGPVVNLASRLQEQALPGQIVIGEATHYQSRRAFEFAPLSLALRGFPEPVRAYAVTEVLPRPEKARGLEGLRAELIGRERELAQLQEALTAVENGRGQIVSLIGEAGVGKSRLVAELRAGCGSTSSLWLEGRCLELNMTTGYSLFLDLLREYFGWRPDEPESQRVARLVATLRELVDRGDLSAERAEEMGPLLGNLLSLRSGTDWDLRLKNASPEQIRHQTLLALQELFVALARHQPVVLVLEDLHWADPLSLDLVSLLMEALPQASLLLLCVYRPEREHRCWQLATIASRKCPERSAELRLRELTPPQSRRLVQSLLGSEQLPASVTEKIVKPAQGNPFFVEELVHALIDTGRLYQEGDVWKTRQPLSRQTGDEAVGVPGSVQSVILSRVDRLERDLRRVLESASVMGRLCRRRLIERIAGPETRIERVLWELEERGLIYQERVVPEEEYSFKHFLTQETIYASLPRHQRMTLHQQVGEAIEGLYCGELEQQYEQLAYHYERSEADEKAVEYLLKAGEKARGAYLNEAAIGYFQRALERLEDGSPLAETHPEWRLEALQGLGRIYHGTGSEAQAEGCFRRAIRLGQEIGVAPRELVRLYFWLGDVLHWQSRDEEKAPIAERGLALLGEDTECVEAALMNFQLDQHRRNALFVERLPYCEELRVVYVGLAMTCVHEDRDVAEGIRWLHALARRAEQQHDLRALGQVHFYMAHFLDRQGDLQGSLAESQRGLDLLTKIGDDKHARWPLATMSEIFLSLGDLAKAEEYAQRSCELGERVGNPRDIAELHRMKGVLALCRGRLDEAATALQKSADLLRDINPRFFVQAALPLARTDLARGNRRKALEQFQELLPLAQTDAPALAACLSGLEDAFDHPGAFRAYCHRFREEHPDVNDSPVVQWYLDLPEPCTSYRRSCHDDLAVPLGTDWSWLDPFDDCSFKEQEGLEITAANGRDLWHVNLSAPRLLRSVSGEFAVQTFTSPVGGKPAIGGVLLWKDSGNFLRLDRGTRGKHEISFVGHVANKEVIFGRGRLPGERISLRLERRGSRVRALCSADGQAWFAVGQTEPTADDLVRVGLHAIGAIDRTIYPGAYPEGTAIRFDDFQLWL